MSVNFEELDFRPTPMGVLTLRRRRHLSTGVDIYEIKLGDEFLMSSLFTAAEIELARLGLAARAFSSEVDTGSREAPKKEIEPRSDSIGTEKALARADLDVVVGGLGLGYTAQAALENSRVRSLI